MRYTILIIAIAFGAVLAAIPGVFLYMLNEPPPSLSYFRGVVNSPVAPGGKLQIHIGATVSKMCEAEASRFLVDANGVKTEFAAVEKNQSTDFTYELNIPATAAIGPAKLMVIISWKCNFIQKLFPRIVKQPPLDFEIGDAS
ncbi:MAG: hypothetical protein ABJA10_07510 [Aestuariivirga sp.]